MKFGCCVNMQAEDSWGVGYGRIATLKKLGFDYAELPLAQMTAMPDDAFEKEVLAALEDFPCEACNNFFPAQIKLTGPAREESAIRAYTEKSLSRAARCGARVVVLGSSGARNLPTGYPKEKGYAEMAENLRIIAPIAAEKGLRIAIEPLNRMESNMLNSYKSGQYLAALSGQENVGSLVDSYHFLVGNENPGDLRIHMPLHVHLAETLGRTIPETLEDPPLLTFLQTLKDMDYDARISLEATAQGEYEATLESAKKALEAFFS